jgi:hypothetical protein
MEFHIIRITNSLVHFFLFPFHSTFLGGHGVFINQRIWLLLDVEFRMMIIALLPSVLLSIQLSIHLSLHHPSIYLLICGWDVFVCTCLRVCLCGFTYVCVFACVHMCTCVSVCCFVLAHLLFHQMNKWWRCAGVESITNG